MLAVVGLRLGEVIRVMMFEAVSIFVSCKVKWRRMADLPEVLSKNTYWKRKRIKKPAVEREREYLFTEPWIAAVELGREDDI